MDKAQLTEALKVKQPSFYTLLTVIGSAARSKEREKACFKGNSLLHTRSLSKEVKEEVKRAFKKRKIAILNGDVQVSPREVTSLPDTLE